MPIAATHRRLPWPRRVMALLCAGGIVLAGCATRSMWTRQIRLALVHKAVADYPAAREELDLALALAESPPADARMTATTLGLLAEVEIDEERWKEAARALRRAATLNEELGLAGGDGRDANLERLQFVPLKDGEIEERGNSSGAQM